MISSNSDLLIVFAEEDLLIIFEERISMTPFLSVCFNCAGLNAGMKTTKRNIMFLDLIELS